MKQFWDNIRVGTPSFCLVKLVLVRREWPEPQENRRLAQVRFWKYHINK